jgi:glycosyltransferase involved in cell wall biosynthesis
LLGAFAFPYPQGSQIFFAQQARDLGEAGAQPVLLCYGSGVGAAPDAIERIPSPKRLAPRVMGSGPQWGKPLADLALLGTWLRAARRARRRGRPFDFVLAHNVEAAAIALASRRATRTPVVYVAHTLLGHELSAYLPERHAGEAARTGQQIERAIVRRADGVIVLSGAAHRALSPHAPGEVALIPPSFHARPAPDPAHQARTCRRHGLSPGRYALYSGNLDRYQDLDLLAAATRRLPASSDPVVVASHAPPSPAPTPLAPGRETPRPAQLRHVRVGDFEEMRSLIHGAGCLVAPRRRIGGFPIKLLNYMEARRPIIAFAGAAPGLKHGESAWLIEETGSATETADRMADAMAKSLTAVFAVPALGRHLGAGARHQLEAQHSGRLIGAKTVDYLSGLARRPENAGLRVA